jgi:CRISPR/Cas system-associated endonuclease Cas3-HD
MEKIGNGKIRKFLSVRLIFFHSIGKKLRQIQKNRTDEKKRIHFLPVRVIEA